MAIAQRFNGTYILGAQSQPGVLYRGVTYSICPYSKSQIDKAGNKLTHPKSWDEIEDIDNVVEIINSFRSGHNFPLLIFRVDLVARARKIDLTATVAQRLKRLPSIEAKLTRFSTRLTQMEDIGGCRAVLRTVGMVRRLTHLYRQCRTKHQCLHIVDYLDEPRDTGYRGIHLIYAYNSKARPMYNGLKIEIQIRSRQQHAWATAVETVEAFTVQGLKDGKGEPRWQRFFALMGTFIAINEDSNPVPNTTTNWLKLRGELRSLADELHVVAHLESYRATLHLETIPGARFYLVELDASKGETRITGFKEAELERAQETYLAIEKWVAGQKGRDVVLVSVGSIESLKRAYPNYFADTEVFMGIVRQAVSKNPLDALPFPKPRK